MSERSERGVYPDDAESQHQRQPAYEGEKDERKVKDTRSTIIRYFALSFHMIFVMMLFLLTFFLTPHMTMISIQAFAVFGMLVYVPATIGLTARRKQTKWDRAWGEVVYLGYEGGLYLANAIVSGIVGGPSSCSSRLYESGKSGGTRKYPYEPIGSINLFCNTMSAQIALSSLHVVGLLIWGYWIYKIITKLSLSKSEVTQTNRKLWNVSVGELMRRNLSVNSYERRDHEAITPFVHTQAEEREREREPERDVGPYIPPPPYQHSYGDDEGQSPVDGTALSSNNGDSPTNAYSVLRSGNYGASSSSNDASTYVSSDGTPLSPTMTGIVEHKMNRSRQEQQQQQQQQHQQQPPRSSLRRAMDEKENSKDVVRRVLRDE
ncbi:hypothetical protein I302_101204 [Kwoniella bestiolae CBS 10118]|uniref:Uncharacterized protein n=1 Tax=Kwoniella bestiolae CBS 10118 TaxID=1296100 RepID=A0A1B9G777_9TREE|nr:hypothetical protein I302_04577 [Kwoniella bestiolae CBS 10118]OCF26887.1 hypothetical protein I302_04577 [Kwoniella bestiolae CBS 10118]